MENKKLKKSKNGVGRPKYVADVEQLQELFKQVSEKAITNEERMEISSVVRKLYGIK